MHYSYIPLNFSFSDIHSFVAEVDCKLTTSNQYHQRWIDILFQLWCSLSRTEKYADCIVCRWLRSPPHQKVILIMTLNYIQKWGSSSRVLVSVGRGQYLLMNLKTGFNFCRERFPPKHHHHSNFQCSHNTCCQQYTLSHSVTCLFLFYLSQLTLSQEITRLCYYKANGC